jgi:hypothetical protein
MYLLAYDNGNAYLYSVTDAVAAATLQGSIALIAVINGAAIGSLGAQDFVFGVNA